MSLPNRERPARPHRRVAALALFLACLAATPAWPARVDPALRFRTLRTPHFTIHFHQGCEPLARRLAGIAERIHGDLVVRLGHAPGRPTEVVLVDQDDLPNGYATPLPYDTIEIVAAWPSPASMLGNTDDWLTLVFAHEYAHVLLLGRSEGWARGLRWTLGRSALTFPNLSLPAWQVEGLSTLVEHQVTGRGRLSSADFTALVDLALRERTFQPIDRANGGLVAWPSGHVPYAYGGLFHQYLAQRFGEAKLAELARRTSRSFYFLGPLAFRPVFGQPAGRLWKEFLASRAAALPAEAASPVPIRQLTHHGFGVARPRFTTLTGPGRPAGESADRWQVAYAQHDADRFPGILVIGDAVGEEPRRLADAYGTQSVAPFDHGRLVLFDQIEFSRSVALKTDLFVLDRARGRTERLSHAARLLEADVRPDGRAVAAVQYVNGARTLVVHELTTGADDRLRLRSDPIFRLSENGAHYGNPRWSPDGGHLAVERQWLHGGSEVVAVDARTARTSVLVSSAVSRNVTPVFLPDGHSVVFASDRAAGPLSLYAIDVTTDASGTLQPGQLYRVLAPTGGAREPDIRPDGNAIVFVGATASGADLFVAHCDRATWVPLDRAVDPPIPFQETPAAAGAPGTDRQASGADSDTRPYSPLGTLLPRSWMPALWMEDDRVKIGAEVSGYDVLGYHGYAARALWPATGPEPGQTGRARPSDWSVSYAYTRWIPTVFASTSRRSRLVPLQDYESAARLVERREDTWEAGFVLPRDRIRLRQRWLASVAVNGISFDSATGGPSRARNALRFAWSLTSAHQYGYSISPESGVTLAATSEQVRPGLGADGSADTFTAEGRFYAPLGKPHAVLAARLAAGRSIGDSVVLRRFEFGGTSATPGVADFGSGGLNLLRGADALVQSGTSIVSGNVEIRWPLARIERGVGLVPLFVRTLHVSGFADAGEAWTRRFRRDRLLRSVGTEILLDAVVGFGAPVTVAIGVAWVDGSPSGPSFGQPQQWSWYLRLGRAF